MKIKERRNTQERKQEKTKEEKGDGKKVSGEKLNVMNKCDIQKIENERMGKRQEKP